MPSRSRSATLLAATLSLALTGCSSEAPDQTLLGSWSPDVRALQHRAEQAPDVATRRVLEMQAKAFAKMQLTLGGDGIMSLTGTPDDGRGPFEFDSVQGDTVLVTFRKQDQPKQMRFVVRDHDHVEMHDPDAPVVIQLVRR